MTPSRFRWLLIVCLSLAFLPVGLWWEGSLPTPAPERKAISEMLKARNPEVLVMGESLAAPQNRRIGRALGEERPLRVQSISLPPHAAAWYSVLEHEVLAQDQPPHLIILMGKAEAWRAVAPTSGAQRLQLESWMDVEEPLLGPKVFGYERLDAVGARVRRGWEKRWPSESPAPPVPIEKSLWPDFQALARAHDLQIIVAQTGTLAPEEPSVADLHGEWSDETTRMRHLVDELRRLGLVSGEEEKRLVEVSVERVGELPALEQAEVRKVDGSSCEFSLALSGMGVVSNAAIQKAGLGDVSPLRLYQDGHPLTPGFSRDELSKGCVGGFLHGLSGLLLSPTDSPDTTHNWKVTVDPALPGTLEDGRDLWWLYPGTGIRWNFAPRSGPRVVQSEVLVFPPDFLGNGPELQVGEQWMPFLPAAPGVWQAKVEAPDSSEPWTVEIKMPAGGAWAVVSRLWVGEGESLGRVVGPGPAEVPLLEGKLRWEKEPAAVGAHEVASGQMALPPELAGLADSVWAGTSGTGRCSPLQVLEDGRVLKFLHRKKAEVEKHPNAVAHEPDGLYFSASDGNIATHHYSAALNPDRRCGNFRWMYPGDVLQMVPSNAQMKELSRGADRLSFSAILPPNAAHSGSFRLKLMVEQKVLLEKDVPWEWLDGSIREWMLPERVLSRDHVSMWLQTDPSSPYLLIRSVSLIESLL